MMLEEVLVTATRRETTTQSIAESIVAISGEDLSEGGIVDFASLTDSLPGVELRNAQPGSGSVSIRGISELNSANLYGGTGSAVGFYMDELPLTMAGNFPDMATYDLERIEVLRGPQGTLYGEGSLAGTVRVITRAPDTEAFGGSIEGTFSDTTDGGDNNRLAGALNIPIVEDKLALRVVGTRDDRSGFIDSRNFFSGAVMEEDANESEITTLRGSLLWQATEDLDITFTAGNSSLDISGRNRASDALYNTISLPENTDDDTDVFNLTLRYQTDFGEFTSSTSYLEREIDGIRDNGGLTPSVNFIFSLFGIPPRDGISTQQTIEVEAKAQEFRLVSDSEGPLNWTAGVFYKEHDSSFLLQGRAVPEVPVETWQLVSTLLIGFPIDTSLRTDTRNSTEQWAVYGELTWDISDDITLVAGGRYFEEERDSITDWTGTFVLLTGGPPPGSAVTSGDEDLFNPRVSVTWDVSDDVMLYATYSQGFRSGGQNDLFVFVPNGNVAYDSEELTNYEFGIKSQWLDNRLQFNASVFMMDWENLQTVVAEGPGGVGEVVGNVGDATTQGLDFELKALLTPQLELNIAGAIFEAETDEDIFVPDPSGGPALLLADGARIPRTSESSFSANARYQFEVGESMDGFAMLRYSYVGDAVDQIARQREIPSYDVLSARVGISGENWTATLFADNLTDEEIRLGLDSVTDSLTGGNLWTWGRPRTVGLTLNLQF